MVFALSARSMLHLFGGLAVRGVPPHLATGGGFHETGKGLTVNNYKGYREAMKDKPRKKTGKPADPANARRTLVWQVRLSPEEHAAWLAMGKGRDAGSADIVRGLIAESLKRKTRKG